MKKVIAILCMLLMVFALAACGAPKPESTVEQFCEAMKKFDVEGMNACLAQPREDIGEISDDGGDMPETIWNYIKGSAADVEYTVNTAVVDGEKATVKVDFTYNDASKIMSEALGQYLLAAFGMAFSEDSSDEALLKVFGDAFDNAAASAEAKTATKTVEFDCILKDGQWLIADMPDGVEYVLTSNVIVAFEELDNLGEDEEINEEDYSWTDVPAGTETQLSTMKITVLECSEENTISGSWDSATADEGTKFVVFKLKVEDTTNDTVEFSAPPLYDKQGRHYEEYEDAGWVLDDEFSYTELAPNIPKTGTCVYNVPQDCDGYYVAVIKDGTDDAFRFLGK